MRSTTETDESNHIPDQPKRPRKLAIESTDLDPYRKKPKMHMFSYEIVEISVPHSATEARKKDFDWLVSHAVKDEDVPMWVQYNSEIFFKN